LLDIVLAVEGAEPAFRCAEIRQRGPRPLPGKPTRSCEINAAMQRAEQAYRKELARITIAKLGVEVEAHDTGGRIAARRSAFLDARARTVRVDPPPR
jgi:DNA-binding IscR family transcriptional regulator